MARSNICIADCASYDAQSVQNAMDSVIEQLGGLEKYVFHNAKVFVKVNLVRDMPPERCGTTHPQAVIALVKRLSKITPNIVIGDSSGGLYTKSAMNAVYCKCRMDKVADETCAVLNDDFTYQSVNLGGETFVKCDITNSFLSADAVINFAKLKTHSFAGYSGAAKNLFGLVPGLVKVEMHSRFPDLGDFCNLLCDIERFASSKIVLHFTDAVIGMEGDGPTNGTPKFIGKLLACPDPYLLDYASLKLICGNPLAMPLLQTAQTRGLIDKERCEQCCKGLEADKIADFNVPPVTSADAFLHMPKWMKVLSKKHLTKKVRMSKKTCRGCGKCAMHCPAKAITIKNGKASVAQKKCIRCYCCQELCPFDAVKFVRPVLYRFVHRQARVKRRRN